MVNLIHECWLPVVDREGKRRWVRPVDLSDPMLVAFDADRADFNGGLNQFGVNLLQTTSPVEAMPEWRRLYREPPDAATLMEWFAPVAEAFELTGDGARFMQDLTLDDGDAVGVAGLLIDSPGDNTIRNNTDHFVKRGDVEALCPHCAAIALFTLQLNAPSGGAGHRTGLRGGGPLTTLVSCQPKKSLWHDLWLNVMEKPYFLSQGGDPTLTAPHFTFPWLAEIEALQKAGGEVTPAQVHPAHVYWAMPRRIRLEFSENDPDRCDICDRAGDRFVRRYITKNYGLNYKGPWVHPLSPYYLSKDNWLPVHPQPGGFGYRHWLAWVAGFDLGNRQQRPAGIVGHVLRHREEEAGATLSIHAFGFDMSNMKARCWYEATIPLYGLADCDAEAQREVEMDVGAWLLAAELAVGYLRNAVKNAWFRTDARGDFSAIDASFWSATEPAFYRLLQERIEAARASGEFDGLAVNESWLQVISAAARRLFDETFVGAGAIEQQNPARVATAFQHLDKNLRGKRMRETLGLPKVSDRVKTNTTFNKQAA